MIFDQPPTMFIQCGNCGAFALSNDVGDLAFEMNEHWAKWHGGVHRPQSGQLVYEYFEHEEDS